MEIEGYLPRLIESEIRSTMEVMGAVSIEGPKACGKTWCARRLANSEYSLVDPRNNFSNRRMATVDPLLALEGEKPHLIDEWQDVPGIWDAVRYSVDSDNRKGRYILCGSSSADKTKMLHSGAGRISSIRMRTMSLLESGESDGRASLSKMFDGRLEASRSKDSDIEGIASMIVRGGWPGMLGVDPDRASLELGRYLRSACEIDAQRIDGRRRNVGSLMRVIRSLARNESTVASKSKIASDIKEDGSDAVAAATVDDYLDVLSRLFLTEDQPAYSASFRSSLRVGKNPKRHFTDPSLAVAAMEIGTEGLQSDMRTMGFMFEGLCERDLRIYAQNISGKLYHYRDYKDHEIDAVVEVPGKGWGAFEIKLGSDSEDTAAEGLMRIRDLMESNGISELPRFLCVITGTGGLAYRRDDGVYVVPITSLGP